MRRRQRKIAAVFDAGSGTMTYKKAWMGGIAVFVLGADRAHAEELFAKSLAGDAANVYNVTKMAGSYLGVAPD